MLGNSAEANPHLSLLDSSRDLVIAVLKTYGVEKMRPGGNYSLESVRFNRGNHWTARGEHTRSRCKEFNGCALHLQGMQSFFTPRMHGALSHKAMNAPASSHAN